MHFLSLADLSRKEMTDFIDRGIELKRDLRSVSMALRGKTLALLFMKHSTRTRVSFEVAMHQTGGDAIYLSPETTQLGRGETIADTARTLSRYADAIAVRLFDHADLLEIAQYSSVPVVNALTDFNHPCQVLADLMTVLESKGKLEGIHVTFLGAVRDNIVNSLLHACPQLGLHLTVSGPTGQSLSPEAHAFAREHAEATGTLVRLEHDPVEAIRNADVVYTDVWFSMHEQANDEGLARYDPYQVNAELMAKAPSDAVFMHCMPIHRGSEATDEVADSPNSLIFDQAENRLHIQKAILLDLLQG